MALNAPSYLCVIPVRAGSKGIPGKNLRSVAGKPLVQWTIERALECTADRRVVVSTDSPAMAELALACGAEAPFLRPAHLADDAAPTEPAVIHALQHYWANGYRPDAVVLLQATSPVRRPGFVDAALEEFERSGVDSLLSVSEIHPFLWRDGEPPEARYDHGNRPRRQDLDPAERLFGETGSLYVTKTAILESTGNRLGGRIGLFHTTRQESVDIDTEDDLAVADALLRTSMDGPAKR